MLTLQLALKWEYFRAIQTKAKVEEYRIVNEFWTKRIVGKEFDRILFTHGYPSSDDLDKMFIRPWRGYVIRDIQHPLFGPDEVKVFAIRCN